ncbi:MAG: hypothetical protein WA708_09345 [Acidobacteriaceae bacterium]
MFLLSLFSMATYLVGFLYILLRSWRLSGGQEFYALDDAYIHASIARHLVQDGNFGISPHAFAAASSSILWPLLPALCFWLFGVHAIIPLLLNAVFSLLTLWAAGYWLWKLVPSASATMIVGLQLVLLASIPLLTLTFTGMEHTMQVLLTLWFLFLSARFLHRPVEAHLSNLRHRTAWLCLSAFLLVGSRYEGAFVVAAAALLLVLQKRFRVACGLLLAGSMAPVLFGIFSIVHGSHFLPNSLLLKAAVREARHPFQLRIIAELLSGYAWISGTLPLLVVGMFLLFRRWNRGDNYSIGSIAVFVFVFSCGLHLDLAKLGWMWRYEAYLIASGIFALFVAAAENMTIASDDISRRRPAAVAVLVICGLASLSFRAVQGTAAILPSIETIYDQQFQMAQFAREYYARDPIIANDVGAISFLGDHRMIDVFGLGSIAVTNSRINHRYTPATLNAIALRGKASVAMVYSNWVRSLTGGMPHWTKVAEWNYTFGNSQVLNGRRVTFYAVLPKDVPYLKRSLQEYAQRLPSAVRCEYF